MTAKEPNSILNSELAYAILQLLSKKENGDYGKRISNELGTPQSSVCRALTTLTDHGFVKRGKRTRAQFYEIDYNGIAEFWYESLKNELHDGSKEKKIMEDEKETVTDFGRKFFRSVIEKHEGEPITVSELLYNSFIYSVGEKLAIEGNIIKEHRFLRPVGEGAIRKLEMHGYPEELEKAIEEVESS